jgi:hypothetical protein
LVISIGAAAGDAIGAHTESACGFSRTRSEARSPFCGFPETRFIERADAGERKSREASANVIEHERKICSLHLALRQREECPGAACPFWEEGGALLDEACVIERLSLDAHGPSLAGYLLELRAQLESARDNSERQAAWRLFAQVVPPDISGR